MFTLAITDKHGNVVDEGTFEEGEILVGRSESADVVLPSDNVSRKHARIYTVHSRCYVEDLGSSNGVFVNGRRIHEAYQVETSAQIKVGDYYILIQGAAKEDAAFGRLRGKNLDFTDKVFEINEKVMLVGRGKDCALTFVDGSISRAHAKFSVDPSGAVILEDLNSSNGTFVNDEAIQVTTLKGGDSVRFGNAEFDFTLPETTTNKQPAPEWTAPPRKSRKGLWITISILVVLLATGAVLLAVFADELFGDDTDSRAVSAEQLKRQEENQKRAEEIEREKAEQIEKLEGEYEVAISSRQWKAALKVLEELDEKKSGDQDIYNRRSFVQNAIKHEALLTEAKQLLKGDKPGKAAEKYRLIKRGSERIKTPYLEAAEKGLAKLKAEDMRHAEAELTKVRGSGCKQQNERLRLCEIILAIDRSNAAAKAAKEAAEEAKAKKRCKD